uniref:Uncharacterized protein n=1 Tax=Anguilla anguilla TaxID=7936 RepID=A0A0E9XMW9_ANGAN
MIQILITCGMISDLCAVFCDSYWIVLCVITELVDYICFKYYFLKVCFK